MTRADLRHDAHGAQKKLNYYSALDVRELGRETVGETSLSRFTARSIPEKPRIVGALLVAEMLALATVCRSVTRCYPRRDLCFGGATAARGRITPGRLTDRPFIGPIVLPGADYAVPLKRSMPRAATSTTAHTLRTAASMKAEYAARPMRSQMLRPMVSAATTVSARKGAGSRS